MPADSLLAPLAAAPEESALIFDIDGTLSPIAERPELAYVPEETRTELRRLVARYRLVACVSGRAGEDARRLVDVEGLSQREAAGRLGLAHEARAHLGELVVGQVAM